MTVDTRSSTHCVTHPGPTFTQQENEARRKTPPDTNTNTTTPTTTAGALHTERLNRKPDLSAPATRAARNSGFQLPSAGRVTPAQADESPADQMARHLADLQELLPRNLAPQAAINAWQELDPQLRQLLQAEAGEHVAGPVDGESPGPHAGSRRDSCRSDLDAALQPLQRLLAHAQERTSVEAEPGADRRAAIDLIHHEIMDIMRELREQRQIPDVQWDTLRAELDAQMREVAATLARAGITTADQLQTFLSRAHRRDRWVHALTAALGQIGYLLGMGGMVYLIGPRLAPILMNDKLGPAFAFGAIVGLFVGPIDGCAGSGAARLRSHLSRAARGNFNNAAAERMAPTFWQALKVLSVCNGVGGLLKNLVGRVGLVSLGLYLQYVRDNRQIPSEARQLADFLADGVGAVFAAIPISLASQWWLNTRSLNASAVLSNRNLPNQLEHLDDPTTLADVGRALQQYLRGLVSGLVSPQNWAVTLLVIVPLVALLIMINSTVLPAVMDDPPATAATTMPGSTAFGTTTPFGDSAAADTLSMQRHLAAATNSSFFMALLSFLAVVVGMGSSQVGSRLARAWNRNPNAHVPGLPGTQDRGHDNAVELREIRRRRPSQA